MTKDTTASAEMETRCKCSCINGKRSCSSCDGSGLLKERWESIIDFLCSKSFEYGARYELSEHMDYTSEQKDLLVNYIQSLQSKNAKLLADWRKMENALARISAFGDGEHSTIAHDIIRELSYQDSPTAHD